MMALHMQSGGRYPVLRSLGILYLVGAGLMVVTGAVVAAWCLFAAPQSIGGRVILAAGTLAATFFLTLMFLAIAELTKLMIDIEHNTRQAAVRERIENIDPSTGDASPAAGGRVAQWLEGEETAEAALMRGR